MALELPGLLGHPSNQTRRHDASCERPTGVHEVLRNARHEADQQDRESGRELRLEFLAYDTPNAIDHGAEWTNR